MLVLQMCDREEDIRVVILGLCLSVLLQILLVLMRMLIR